MKHKRSDQPVTKHTTPYNHRKSPLEVGLSVGVGEVVLVYMCCSGFVFGCGCWLWVWLWVWLFVCTDVGVAEIMVV